MDQFDLDDMTTDDLLDTLRGMSGGQIAALAKKSSAAQRTRLSTTLETLIRETELATAEARRRLDHLIREHNALGALGEVRALHETLDDGL